MVSAMTCLVCSTYTIRRVTDISVIILSPLKGKHLLSISPPTGTTTDSVGKTTTGKRKLTQKSLDILWAAVIWPVSVLQMPHRPFLPRQKVLDL